MSKIDYEQVKGETKNSREQQAAYLAERMVNESRLSTILRRAEEESEKYPDNWESVKLNAHYLRVLQEKLRRQERVIIELTEEVKVLEEVLGDSLVEDWRRRRREVLQRRK